MTTEERADANPFADRRLLPSGALLEAQVALEQAFERHVNARAGLDSYTADLLVQLMRAPEQRLRGVDIARQLLISPSHTTRLIDRAESSGLVERTPDPTDRRAQLIVLTGDGEARARAFAPHMLSLLDAVFGAAFTASELRTMTRLLIRVRDAAREVAERDEL